MAKFNAPVRNYLREQRSQKSQQKRKRTGDPSTKKLKLVPPPSSLSGKQKKKLLKKWRLEQKKALENGLVSMEDIQMMSVDNQGSYTRGFRAWLGCLRYALGTDIAYLELFELNPSRPNQSPNLFGPDEAAGEKSQATSARPSMQLHMKKRAKLKILKGKGKGKGNARGSSSGQGDAMVE